MFKFVYILLFCHLSLNVFATDSSNYLVVSKEEFLGLSQRTDLLENIPDAYRLTAYGIHEYYKCADDFLSLDEIKKRNALLDMLILVSEGCITNSDKKFSVHTQITSVTYYANLTNKPDLTKYFINVTTKIVDLLDSKNTVESDIALRILQNMFPAAINRDAGWFKNSFFKEEPLFRLWSAVDEGKKVVFPMDLEK